MKTSNYIVYKITNKISGKAYIGSTVISPKHNFKSRLTCGYLGYMKHDILTTVPEEEHCSRLVKNTTQGRVGFKAYEANEQKYYKFEILVHLSNVTKSEAHMIEQEWIDALSPELNYNNADLDIDISAKEDVNAYYRAYREVHREKIRTYNREYMREWRKNNPGYHRRYKSTNSYKKKGYKKKERYVII